MTDRSKPTLDYDAEPFAELRARYAAALEPVYDPVKLIEGNYIRPGEQRRHVFDFTDGLRLIISRDVLDDLPVIHVSASVKPHTDLYRELATGLINIAAFNRLVDWRFRELDETRHLELLGVSDGKGIPHFIAMENAR